MRKWIGQPGQQPLTATEKVGRRCLVFCSGYDAPSLFRILQTKEVF